MKFASNRNLRYSLRTKEIRVTEITEFIKKDSDLKYGYQANIAMSYIDCYHQYKKITGKKYLNYCDLHNVANKAAIYFLDIWTS